MVTGGSNQIRCALFAFLSLWLVVVAPVESHAQVAGATLEGTATDASGALIPNAQISIKNVATGIHLVVTTNEDGFYLESNLLPGIYEVVVSAPGFATQVQSGINLAVGAQQRLNFTMSVGTVTNNVVVTDTASSVQLSTSSVSSVVNSTTVRELPLNGRDWTQLATLEAGVVSARTQPATSAGLTGRATRGFGNQLSDAGHRPPENNYRVNGISVVDYANDGPGSVIGGALGVDAVAEFSVVTSNYSAEYGRASGVIINAITKSGANDFHGDAFWFIRDEDFDARNYFDPQHIPSFHRNQFGGSGGGPIKKDRTFIFASYEGIRQDEGLTFNDHVPSAAARAGNLCSVPNGQCVPSTITVSPLVAPYLGFYPLPNGGLIGNGDTGVLKTSGNAQFAENYVTVRLDHKISEKDGLAGSWFLDTGPFTQPDALVDVVHELFTRRQMFSLEETHSFSSRFVNVARLGYSRSHAEQNEPVRAINPLANDPSLAAIPGQFAPILTVPGLTLMQGAEGDPTRNSHFWNSFQFYDDALLTKGTHLLKFGFASERMQYNLRTKSRQNGSFTFPSLAGFLQDQPTSVSLLDPAISQEVGTRQSLFGAYLQDDWRVFSNLTLNLGVRYEPTTNPTEAHDRFQLVRDFFNGGSVPVNNIFASNPTLRNVQPRVGFAWDPFHNGKTAIRGGFGLFDVLPINWMYTIPLATSLPFSFNVSQGHLPAGSFPTGALALIGFDPTKAQQRYIEPSPPRNYAMNWNFNIQREITPSLLATFQYVGSHTVHQANTPNNSNMVLPTLTSAGYLWPFPVGSGSEFNQNVGTLDATRWDGSSHYNALDVQVTKNMSHGFQIQGSYTWGKCIDDGSAPEIGDPYVNSIGSPLWFDPSARRGLCDFNVGQNFAVNYVWNIPAPSRGGAVARHVLGGWEVGGIFTAATGTPFSMLIAGDPDGMKGEPWPFPDRLSGPGCGNPVNPGNPSNFVKLNCFSPPIAPASFAAVCQPAAPSVAALIPNTCMNLAGNAGRNRIIGPGLADFDFSLFKNIPIGEAFKIQLRMEAFNIFNRANFQSPVDNLFIFNQDGTPVSGAGAIDGTTTTARQIQFGLKLNW